jgi:transcriptional regulator
VYVPPQFRQDDVSELRAFVASTRLATLVTGGTAGLRASHVPMLFAPPTHADAHGSLHFHLARANEQWRDLANGAPAMAIFLGPDAYVSPTFYEGHAGGAVVPTWDYVAVHAHGIARVIEDPGELHALVSKLTDAFEAERADAWSVDDAPQTYMEKQLRGIVGVEIAIERFDAKWKMSQNRSVGDRRGIVAGLRESPFESERRTADIVARFTPPRES